MEYNYEDVEKVINFSSWSEDKKIGELFRIDTYMYTNLGTESTKKEREDVTKKSKYIYRAISKINPSIGKHLISNMDS
tara:strand:+ start:477 stop:710 length:234 start_codon:yes stop_codon:yes gene_type:complete